MSSRSVTVAPIIRATCGLFMVGVTPDSMPRGGAAEVLFAVMLAIVGYWVNLLTSWSSLVTA